MIADDYMLELEPGLEYHPMSKGYYRLKSTDGTYWNRVESYTFEEIEDYLKEHHYGHWCSRKLGLDY